VLPTPFMASGFVGLNQNIFGNASITISAFGSSPILQFNATVLNTPALTLSTVGADIGTSTSPIVTKNITQASGNSTLTLSAGGTTGSAYVKDTSTGSITLNTSSVGSAGTMFIQGTANTAALNTAPANSLSGGTIVLVSNQNIGSNAGLPGTALQITGAGPTRLTTQALNGAVYVNSATPLILQSTTVGSTFNNTSSGDFEVFNSAGTSVNGSGITGGTSGTGLVSMTGTTLSNTSTITGPTVTLNFTTSVTNTGTISATSGTTGNVTITVPTLTNSGEASVISGALNVTINGQLLSPLTVTNEGLITALSNSAANGKLTIAGPVDQNVSINNSGTLNANSNTGTALLITATAGASNPNTGNIYISGGGIMQALNVPASGLTTPQVSPILVRANLNAGNLTAATFIEFTGSQTFATQAANAFATDPSAVGAANFVFSQIPNLTVMVQANNLNQSIIFDDKAQVVATNSLTLNSLNIAVNGTGNVTANQTLNFDFMATGTPVGAGASYGPSPGVLGNAVIRVANGNFTFSNTTNIVQYASLAVIASGDILWASTPQLVTFPPPGGAGVSSPANEINLSNNTANNCSNGGNLTSIAGFNTSNLENPISAGAAVIPPNITTVGGPSQTGGSILLPGVN